jgi:inorganic pyrophosphatase
LWVSCVFVLFSIFFLFLGGPAGQYISPWHDIPLDVPSLPDIYHMIVEIPRWTSITVEVHALFKLFVLYEITFIIFQLNPLKPLNPLCLGNNDAPEHQRRGYIWNYGALPQTLENPEYSDADTKTEGFCFYLFLNCYLFFAFCRRQRSN